MLSFATAKTNRICTAPVAGRFGAGPFLSNPSTKIEFRRFCAGVATSSRHAGVHSAHRPGAEQGKA